MNAKHTPGPWSYHPATAHPPTFHVFALRKSYLASVPNEGNARLIAAAPDLLAAVELSRRNVGSILNMLPVKADKTERKALETWLGELNGALAKANVF